MHGETPKLIDEWLSVVHCAIAGLNTIVTVFDYTCVGYTVEYKCKQTPEICHKTSE